MNTLNHTPDCNECFGTGARELLVVLEKPELNRDGKIIRYVRKSIPCTSCLEKKISRLARLENPVLRETEKNSVKITELYSYDKLFLR